MSWEHELAKRIKDQGKTGGIETGYLVGEVISPKWSEADEAWTDGELIISTLEGQAMLTEGMLDRLDAGGELHDGMTVALIPGARALRGGQRFFVAEIPGHGALPGRDSPDCHPIEAITGLRAELDDHDDRLDHLETIRVPALEHDMNEAGGRVPVLEGRVEALEDLESALGEDLSDLSDRVDDIVTHGGEPNVIETVKRNGVALPVSGKAVDVSVPTKVSQLTNDSGYISQESDPTVPAWAKEASKPSYTAEEVGAAEAGHTHPYLPLTGGTLSGGLAVQPASGTPILTLSAPEQEGTGRSKTVLQKNASASDDYGTMLADYPWGAGTTADQRTVLRIQAAAAALKDRLVLIDYAAGGSYVLYHLYGEHNPPEVRDVTGLQAVLNGKAAASHIHSAGDITGTLSANRLPVVPIAKGGTGQTDALAAITALGGLSAGSLGTPISSGDDIDSYLTPGTYWSENSTISASLQGTPPWTGGGFKLFVVKSHTNRTFFHIAIGASAVGIRLRAKPNEASPWGDWVDLSTSGHTHGSIRANGSIAEDTAPGASDRLLITDASDGNLIKRGDIRLDGTTTDKALTPKGTWESFLPLSGGTLTGNLTLDPTGNAAPVLTLVNAEKEGVGASRVQLRKNASASGDYGSLLTDFTWGDETTATKYARLTLWAAAGSLPAMLQLTYNNGAGSSKGYQLYGDHNRPMLDGQTVMTGSEDLNTMTSYGWYRCRTNSQARQIKHTPQFDATTLVNSSMVAFNLTIGRCASDYVYQEIQLFNTGKRWYRYTSTPTAASPTWSAWTEH